MTRMARAVVLFGAFSLAMAGQEPPPLRITVRLVQIDAVVHDKNGRPIDNLKREELHLFQDGRERKITHFSFVSGAPAAAPSRKSEQKRPSGVFTPTQPMTVQNVRRTVALVVDDLGLSWESMHRVKDAVREFVDTYVQPDDAVAIVRTGTGIGSLQQFTTDRRMLYAAIDRLRWTGLSRGGVDSVQLIDENEVETVGGSKASSISIQTFERFRSRAYTLGTLGALSHVIEELASKPGRKSAVLFSDGLQTFASRDDQLIGGTLTQRLRRLCENANRAGVSFYTVDARGLVSLSMRAGDALRTMGNAQPLGSNRYKDNMEYQEGLAMLARETGGIFSANRNDLALAAANALGDQSGYYLIGYDPGPGIFENEQSARDFHRIKLQVTRPGVTVRTRSGFFGVADRPPHPPPTGGQSQLLAAIRNPFQSGDIGLRLSAVYAITDQTGPAVLNMLYIEGSKLDFRKIPDGRLQATVDVAVVSFGEEGHAEASSKNTYEILVKPEQLDEARRQGFVYKMTHQLKHAGAFQVRAAVRDAATGRLGSASQFVELPDLKQRKLAVSGVLFTASGGGNAASVLRQFSPKARISYAFEVYNARPDTVVLARLYRDGKPVWTSRETAIEAEQARVPLARELTFDQNAVPGSYVLEVLARRREGNKIRDTASQWADFEIPGGLE